MKPDPGPVVSGGRAACALVLGAFAGGALTTSSLAALTLTDAGDLLLYAFYLALTGAVSTVAWALGLAAVGAPAWMVLHRRGFRGRRTAVISGAVLSSIGSLLLSLGFQVRSEPIRSSAELWPELGLGVIGAIVGLLIWRVAYRSRKPGPKDARDGPA